ncbi:MAG: YicC/YloC family endoribonuclease [Thermodesulfobacteriota bacterium]|nr:YicC/YloC family endoribonuclease [Thermodesulfobacteriota bacterium]
MIRSMTGYGSAETVLAGKNLMVEIKSLNHKNLESSIRLSSFISPLEINIKKRVGELISRGRIEVSVRPDSAPGTNDGDSLEANIPLIKSYYDLLSNLKESFNLTDEITLGMLVQLKDSIYTSETHIDIEAAWDIIRKALDDSIDSLIDMKQAEGRLLYEDFVARIDTINDYIKKLESRIPQVGDEYQARLSGRIRELTDNMACDESRLIQEIAIMAEKSDITEEIVRLKSHIKQFGEMLNSDSAIGRKMDFLLQEMHREINTIGSKSSDLVISGFVIEIKTELAKVKEQAQNIE